MGPRPRRAESDAADRSTTCSADVSCIQSRVHPVGLGAKTEKLSMMRHPLSTLKGSRIRLGLPLHATQLMKSSTGAGSERNEYILPWPHCSRPIARRAPLWHRIAGQFLLHRGSQRLGTFFSTSDFLLGVSDAVKAYGEAINQTSYQDLEAMLSPPLYKIINSSLCNLSEGSEVDMAVTAVKGQALCSVSAVFGHASQDDEHSIEWLGQKLVTSKSRMMEILEGNSNFTFKNARSLGAEATMNRLEFILGVSFFTRTYFKVVDSSGQILQGNNEFVDDYHYWKFSSQVAYEEEYPYKWIIADINNFMHNI